MKRSALALLGVVAVAGALSVLPGRVVSAQSLSGIPAAPPSVVAAPAVAASGQTYTVLVGAEDIKTGAELNAFFPATIHVHPGDTVLWKQGAHEIHTVTFLANGKMPDLLMPIPNAPAGAMAFNPQVAFPAAQPDSTFDGTSYTNSGITGMDQGQVQQFSLTFTQPGTYNYVCVVHGMMMPGTVIVDSATTAVPSQVEVDAQAKKEIDALMAQVPAAIQAANADVKPDVKNADGTTTHYVTMGYDQGQIMLAGYFPQNLTVAPGDKVDYLLGTHSVAPHTATFLNGQPEPDLVLAQKQPSGPPLLTFNPLAAAPQNPDKPLSTQGVYSSGLLDPTAPGPHDFAFTVGADTGSLPFLCTLHVTEGMTGVLTVTK